MAASPVEVECVRVRDATAADWREIATLHALSWRTAYRGILSDAYLDGPVETERLAVWEERFTGPARSGQVVVLAEDDRGGGPLAFACILAGHHPRWGSLIDNLHVRPDAKRLRLGRRVLREAALRVPPDHAGTPLHLTVLEGNGPAIAAYEGWGGTIAERLVEHVGRSGEAHPVRRYAWPSPAELAGSLAAG